MTRLLRYFLLFTLLFVAVGIISAQEESSIRGLHKVKRKETIFGISRMYDITIEELIAANPEMKDPDYELKKGDVLKIPFPGKTVEAAQSQAKPSEVAPVASGGEIKGRPIRFLRKIQGSPDAKYIISSAPVKKLFHDFRKRTSVLEICFIHIYDLCCYIMDL